MTTTKPSAGAVRAADKLIEIGVKPYSGQRECIAEIVDRESGLAELLIAAKAVLGKDNPRAGEAGHIDLSQACAMLQTALVKATNPNSTVQQVSPTGRWTEKGTV